MNFKNFSRAQFSKLRNGINGVGKFRYDTICSQTFRINRIIGMEIVKGGPKLYTDTHTYRHTHTHMEAHFISLVFLRKCRNKAKNGVLIFQRSSGRSMKGSSLTIAVLCGSDTLNTWLKSQNVKLLKSNAKLTYLGVNELEYSTLPGC